MVYIRKSASSLKPSAKQTSSYKRPNITYKPKFTGSGSYESGYNQEAANRGAGMNAWYQAGSPGDRSMPNPGRSNPAPADSLGGLFSSIPPIGGGGGGGGGGSSWGRSGGGGGGGVSAEAKAAYKALLEAYKNGDGAAFDKYEEQMRAAYDPSKINAIYDQASKGVQTAATAGLDRLGPIMAELNARAAQGRTAVNGAFSQGDARLKALQAEYQQQAQGLNSGLNNVMDAFGSSPVQDTGGQSLLNLFANSRVANDRARTINDASMADRGTVYAGLNSDVQSGITRDQTGLESRVAMQRSDATRQNEMALQQLLGQSGIARLQAEQQRARDELALRAELAQMGITV